jgi:hypothetical protein
VWSGSDRFRFLLAMVKLCSEGRRARTSDRRRAGIGVAHVDPARRGHMFMFKRSQLYIALALAGLAEILVRAAIR